MEKRILGRTGLEVTQPSFGAMELRFGPEGDDRRTCTDQQAEEVLNAVLDAGINFIDTSPDYGLSEERIGRFVSGRRSEYSLATKCGCDPADKGGRGGHIWKADQLHRNIAASLERLQTDHVDVLQLHNPKIEEVDVDELVGALTDIRSQGLTRFIGISSTLPDLPKYLALGAFDTFQIPYSCLQPQHFDALTQVGRAGAGVIVRGGIGKGGPEADVLGRVNMELWDRANLRELCDDVTPAELVLRHTLTHPHCQATIVGTQSLEHLTANVAAAERGPLPAELYAEVDRRVRQALAEIGPS